MSFIYKKNESAYIYKLTFLEFLYKIMIQVVSIKKEGNKMRNGHSKSFILGIIISIFFSMTCMSIPVFAKDAPNGIWTDYAATDFAG